MIFVAGSPGTARVLPTPRELLAEAGRLGLALVADGDNLTVKGPRGAMPAEFLNDLRASKPDLIELLARSAPSASTAAVAADPPIARAEPIPATLADRTLGRRQPDPPASIADLAGLPLDFWRHLIADWTPDQWTRWYAHLEATRPADAGPDDRDFAERRAFDHVVGLPPTIDPRPAVTTVASPPTPQAAPITTPLPDPIPSPLGGGRVWTYL